MDAPIYLFNYILRLGEIPSGILGGVLTKFQNTLRGILGDVPPEIMESIDGRFVGVGRDSGWLVLYQDVGWFAMSVVLLSCCMLFVRGIRTYIENPCPSSVYACALLCYCAFSGLVMRFQVFPAWLFIGLVLIPCLVFWRRIARS